MARPRKRPRTAPRPVSPAAIERAYARDAAALARDLAGVVRRFLAKAIARHEAGDRQDAPEDFAGLDFGLLRIRLGRVAKARASRLVDQYGRRIRDFTAQDVARILQIDVAQEPPEVRATLDAWRRENVALIESIAERLHEDVERVVRESTREGTRVETLAKRLEERYGVTESRARLIARDQTLKANSDLTRSRHEAAGITRYVWSTSRDERVRPMHAELEGTIHSWDRPPVTNEKGDRNHPGRDYQCRCTAIPVLDEEDPARSGTVLGPRPF